MKVGPSSPEKMMFHLCIFSPLKSANALKNLYLEGDFSKTAKVQFLYQLCDQRRSLFDVFFSFWKIFINPTNDPF